MKMLFLFILFSWPAFSSVVVNDSKIVISKNPEFESKLEMKNFILPEKEASLTITGFIVASAQYNFESDRFVNKWVSLDEKVLNANNVDLTNVKPVKDLAYGVVGASSDFEKELKVGQKVLIERYGIAGDHFTGEIVKLVPLPKQDLIQIHFIAFKSPELIAGTNCEVEISHIKKRPFVVSLLSILHLGLEDYIVVKESDGNYRPKRATVLDQDSETATILVNVNSTIPYVARGAILLKPLINEILKNKGPGP